ncbi:MAG: metallophosphoesterase [Clostridiales bacterium]|nr:metallophosphoesterase [Clostridiales bacterium]
MAIYAMSDLHLAIDNPEKTMEAFGEAWKDYINRIRENSSVVASEDLYLMPGDLSWATYLENANKDFTFINELPGKKLIVRGNHDYWWGTSKKMQKQLDDGGYDTITILRNNAYVWEDAVISGTRGWKRADDEGVSEEDLKIHRRELERIRLCLKAMEDADPEHKLKHIFMTHFPPLGRNGEATDYSELIEDSGIVDICLYGHLHGRAHSQIVEGDVRGIKYFCVAADYLKYKPLRVL